VWNERQACRAPSLFFTLHSALCTHHLLPVLSVDLRQKTFSRRLLGPRGPRSSGLLCLTARRSPRRPTHAELGLRAPAALAPHPLALGLTASRALPGPTSHYLVLVVSCRTGDPEGRPASVIGQNNQPSPASLAQDRLLSRGKSRNRPPLLTRSPHFGNQGRGPWMPFAGSRQRHCKIQSWPGPKPRQKQDLQSKGSTKASDLRPLADAPCCG